MADSIHQIHFDTEDPQNSSTEEISVTKEDDSGDFTLEKVKEVFSKEDAIESTDVSFDAEKEIIDSSISSVEVDGGENRESNKDDSSEEETHDDETHESQRDDESTATQPLSQVTESIESIERTLKRLERKFDEDILNSATRNDTVKVMYKEVSEYKAGIVEKALKNLVYDIIDLRETMISHITQLREKKQIDTISLEDVLAYADDMADILTRHDVTIYKADVGSKSVAVRQKIVRRIETEDPAKEKTIASSNSCGYEYNGKVIYPERISIYVKKK